MTTDPLRKLVNDYDRQRNTPRQMQQTERPVSKRRICATCKRVWARGALGGLWMDHLQGHCAPECPHIPPEIVSRCPSCRGALEEVVS